LALGDDRTLLSLRDSLMTLEDPFLLHLNPLCALLSPPSKQRNAGAPNPGQRIERSLKNRRERSSFFFPVHLLPPHGEIDMVSIVFLIDNHIVNHF
jgi:hypothetical protein